ncbi:hypothetical protein [Shouchella clausii]|uniref:hypothetical protein n=1 Tax=Shouchella clausii TaxID=79880 RepID=UPI0004E6A6AB|nr:hypothetical protein [Shouchella clausii]ALA52384.1 hypothetical protein DB29_01556 [Shouchella clausii]
MNHYKQSIHLLVVFDIGKAAVSGCQLGCVPVDKVAHLVREQEKYLNLNLAIKGLTPTS